MHTKTIVTILDIGKTTKKDKKKTKKIETQFEGPLLWHLLDMKVRKRR